MDIIEFSEKVRRGEVDVVSHTRDVIERLKKINDEYNYLNVISEELAVGQAKVLKKNPRGRLAGVMMSVKDCLCVKGIESRAGSKILSGYKPVFDATAVRRAIDEGAIVVGKTSQDEFGFGSFNTNVGVGFKIPKNPHDKERVCGGSSGGSAGLSSVADFAHFSLGESTGGSIAAPASLCGVVGLCPTYGRVSRLGIMDYANSLDKIGPISKTVKESAYVLGIIAGFDPKESTSINKPVENYHRLAKGDVSKLRIGVIREGFGEGVNPEVEKAVRNSIDVLEKKGASIEGVSLPITMKYGLATYYIIATAESSTNLAKYCGMRYGVAGKLGTGFNEFFSKTRSENFGSEAKRRIMLGTFVRMAGYRDAYYIRAMRVRTRIIDEYKALFKSFDVLASPSMPVYAPRFDEVNELSLLESYKMDVLTVGPNLAGLPHISVPVGYAKGLPVGLMLTGAHLEEKKILNAAVALEGR